MTIPKIIDNERFHLLDVLKEVSGDFKDLSIATGYWDLKAMLALKDELEKFDKVRILIGREPRFLAPKSESRKTIFQLMILKLTYKTSRRSQNFVRLPLRLRSGYKLANSKSAYTVAPSCTQRLIFSATLIHNKRLA